MSVVRQIQLRGSICGPIWQGLVCEKYVEELVRENDPRKPRQPLRQRLERILKDGDFQSAHFDAGFAVVFVRRRTQGRNTVQQGNVITDPELSDQRDEQLNAIAMVTKHLGVQHAEAF